MADWYTGWVGAEGSAHHRDVAIPAVLELLTPAAAERVLDVGCGPGVLAPHVAQAVTLYAGVDASARLIDFVRLHHGRHGRFLRADATQADALRALEHYFDALARSGLLVERVREIPYDPDARAAARAERLANREIPLFLGLRAVKR